MFRTRSSRAQARFLAVAVALSVALSVGCGGAGTGCSTLQPIPTGRYVGPKNDNAVNLRLSANGINYLNSNWQVLVNMFAPGGSMTLPVNCTSQNFSIPVLGSRPVTIADQGRASGAGRLDGNCTNDDPASVTATVTGFALVPQGPDKLAATVSLTIATGKLYVLLDTQLCNVKCSIDFSSSRAAPSANTIAAVLQFTIDTKWDKLLAFNVASIDGTQICGASGAPAAPKCIDPADLALSSEGGFCSYSCDVLDIAVVKNFVLGLLSPTLQSQIQTAIAGQTCQACTADAECPKSTDGNNTQATCTNKVCTDPATSKCTPRFLGTEGRMDLSAFLGSFGAPVGASLDLSLAAGSSVTVDQGLTMGTRAGLKPVTVSDCVPPAAAPPMTAVTAPDFDGEATPGSQYHVGLGISANFLNNAFWAAHQAGALCLQLSTANVGLLDTGLFKTLLPSLGKLATRDGKDAPMMVALRPSRPPTTVVGLGTYDPITHKPIKPLITLTMADVNIDFYAMIDDRFVRLFTLTADISLPLSLIFEGCDKVTPALADLKMLIANIRTSNSEMLAEDPQVLADLVPAVIGLAEPALAGALKGFALPSLGNFKLKVNEVKGLGNIAGSENYNHLGLYAQLLPANGMCAVTAPKMVASLRQSVMPNHADMRLDGKHTPPIPAAVLEVHALNKAGTPEFAFQVDEGLWTDFSTVEADTLTVAHPRFLLQGVHTIKVRSRVSEDPQGISAPVSVGFVVDYDAPELTLTTDTAHDQVLVSAHDVVTRDEALLFSYRVGQGDFSAFGPRRDIKLSAVDAQGGVTVRVQDELGNVGEAVYRAAEVALRPNAPTNVLSPEAGVASGCASVPGVELLGLALVLAARRRRS